jgi:chromosome segregation protein
MTYLKSITLKGFKSFPDRTRLEFVPGTSVIVGPNGSGKSNVTDAVLWALGEQSPVAVRGQSMQDVIFGGGPGRQAASSASVELVLDDADQSLGLGSEVSIVRRLDRNGEGEYRLQGARCRLVDILETLSDTGLGKEMHSVISQGRVEAIVTSKPRERRLLIEEAAGLGKHRKRRRRAALKLAHTEENLDRALDVEREARSRLRPLKRQAEAAELHERLHRQMLEARWELARDEARKLRDEVLEAEAEVSRARAGRSELELALQAVAAQRHQAEEALAARSARREQLSRRSYAARSAADRISYRLDSVRQAAAGVADRLERSSRLLEALHAHVPEEPPDQEAMQRSAELRRELEALDADREAELARQLAELERRRQLADDAVAERERELLGATDARGRAEAAHEQARAAVHTAEREAEAARRESARVGGELAAVNQFLRGHQPAPGGGRPLSDALTVEPGYELAVAAALDGRLAAAVVSSSSDAERLLDRAAREGGRVLLSSDGDRDGRRADPSESPAPPGAQALADRIGGEEEAARLARALLRDSWLVDSFEALPSGFTGVAVTRGGRVYDRSRHEMRQAAALGEERVLAERNRREALIAESESAARAERQAGERVRAAAEAAARCDVVREQANAAHRAAVRAREEAVEEQRRLMERIALRRAAPDEGPTAARRAQIEAELRAEATRRERLERERAEHHERVTRLERRLQADRRLGPLIEQIASVIAEIAEVIAARQAEFDAELREDRELGETVAQQLRACATEEVGLQSRLHAASESLTATEVKAQRSRDRAAEADGALRTLAAELELDPEPAGEPLEEQERAQLQARLERLARRREQLGPVNPLAQREYAEATAHVEELEAQRSDLETALRELQTLIRDTDREIRETFEQTFTAAARNFEELAARLFPGGRGSLRLVADAETPARVLGGEAQALESGEDGEPEGDPGEDRTGVEIEITPAGKAMKRLTLLSGGEKSMTALAFLFSVFLARPCPFYILDEVEAALDDLNIDRFLGLLETYSQRAQFIVVTHQKRTMEAADVLYGVSMGGDGISKVISRRLPPRTLERPEVGAAA